MSFSRSRSLSHSRGLTSSRSHSLRVCWREMARTSKSKMLVQVGYPPQCHLDYNVFVQFPIIFAKLSRLCVLTDGPEASNDRSRPWDLWSFSSSPSGTSQELSTKECEKEEQEEQEEQEEEQEQEQEEQEDSVHRHRYYQHLYHEHSHHRLTGVVEAVRNNIGELAAPRFQTRSPSTAQDWWASD